MKSRNLMTQTLTYLTYKGGRKEISFAKSEEKNKDQLIKKMDLPNFSQKSTLAENEVCQKS